LPLLVIAINDNFADGTDVSWLWDVDFEGLKGDVKRVILTGTRADDIALRLKYAGWAPHSLSVTPKVERALNQALATKSQPIYVLPTYTAMLTTRDILYHWGVIHASWED